MSCGDVADGYASSRFTTPNASPIKPVVPHSTPNHIGALSTGNDASSTIPAPYFVTTTEILNSVYTTPPRSHCANVPHASNASDASRNVITAFLASPCTRKRSYTDSWGDESPSVASARLISTIADEDEMSLDEDESPLCPPFPVITTASDRNIKPLRRCKTKDRSIQAVSTREHWNVSSDLAMTEAWQTVNISRFANVPPD